MKKIRSRSFIMLTLLGISFYSSNEAHATDITWCQPDAHFGNKVRVVEYGFGLTGFASTLPEFNNDGYFGIYVLAQQKTDTGVLIRPYPIHTDMNLNSPAGNPIISSLKAALLTGVDVKLGSIDGCRTIQSIVLMRDSTFE